MNRAHTDGFLWTGLVMIGLVACRGEQKLAPAENPPKGAGVATEGPLGPVRPGSELPPRPAADRQAPTVRLEPVDLVTSFGETPLQVWIEPNGHSLDEESLSQVVKRVSLLTWPERVSIPVRIRYKPRSGVPGEDQFARIFIEPEERLADRWYALSLENPPAPFRMANDPGNFEEISRGVYVARFRTGSEPIVSALREYAKEDVRIVYVDFSERVQLVNNVGNAFSFELAASAGPCRPADELQDGASATSFRFVCSSSALRDGGRLVVHSRGVRSNSGTPAQDHVVPFTRVIEAPDGSRYQKGR